MAQVCNGLPDCLTLRRLHKVRGDASDEGLAQRVATSLRNAGLPGGPRPFSVRLARLKGETIDGDRHLVNVIARRAGIHGTVALQVRLTKDGRIEVQKLLEGEPVLADAAIDAVKKWQAKPALISGRKTAVISTVTFDFQLH